MFIVNLTSNIAGKLFFWTSEENKGWLVDPPHHLSELFSVGFPWYEALKISSVNCLGMCPVRGGGKPTSFVLWKSSSVINWCMVNDQSSWTVGGGGTARQWVHGLENAAIKEGTLSKRCLSNVVHAMPEGSGHTAQDKIWKDDQVKWGKECRFVTGKFLNMRAALRSFTNCTTFSEESPPPRPTLEKSSGVGNPEANAELRLPLSLLFKLQFSWRRQGMHLMLWACRIFDMQWTQVGGYLNTQISMSKKKRCLSPTRPGHPGRQRCVHASAWCYVCPILACRIFSFVFSIYRETTMQEHGTHAIFLWKFYVYYYNNVQHMFINHHGWIM